MKKILSALMCFVLLQAQSFAIRGGPNNSGGEKVLGAYSGVMLETSGGTDLGLYLVAAVANGASSGQVVIFSANFTPNSNPPQFDSDTYLGSMTGLSDASRGGTGRFYGIFNGSANTGNGAFRSVSGQMSLTASRAAGGSATQRLVGTASSRTVAVSSGAGNFATDTGPLKTYACDGWLTSTDNVGNGFIVGGN